MLSKYRLAKTLSNIDRLCKNIRLNRVQINKINRPIPTWPFMKPKYDLSLLNQQNIYVNDFLHLEPFLHWNKPTHLANCDKKDYLTGMKTALIVGDKDQCSLIHHDKLEVGYAYFKPDWEYPAHYHYSEELYYILYGNSIFGKMSDKGFIEDKQIKEGDIIFHHQYQQHRMIFKDDWTLAIYLWYRKGPYYFL